MPLFFSDGPLAHHYIYPTLDAHRLGQSRVRHKDIEGLHLLRAQIHVTTLLGRPYALHTQTQTRGVGIRHEHTSRWHQTLGRQSQHHLTLGHSAHLLLERLVDQHLPTPKALFRRTPHHYGQQSPLVRHKSLDQQIPFGLREERIAHNALVEKRLLRKDNRLGLPQTLLDQSSQRSAHRIAYREATHNNSNSDHHRPQQQSIVSLEIDDITFI